MSPQIYATFDRNPSAWDFILVHHSLRHLKKWAQPQKRKIPWIDWPGKSYIHPEPKVVVLIIGPWNYPFLVVVSTLIGALASDNCAVLKPSEYAPKTGSILEEIISTCFPKGGERGKGPLGSPMGAQHMPRIYWGSLFRPEGLSADKTVLL